MFAKHVKAAIRVVEEYSAQSHIILGKIFPRTYFLLVNAGQNSRPANAAIFVGNRFVLAPDQNVTGPQVRSRIGNLRPTTAPDLTAKLEQGGIELRSAMWAGDSHGGYLSIKSS
jgi:hypothetical protein